MFLNNYIDDGEKIRKPIDPVEPPKGEWEDYWIDATDTVNLRGRIYMTLECECTNIQLTYRMRSWCQCKECGKILIDTEQREIDYNNPVEKIEVNKEKSSLEKLVEDAKSKSNK